MGRPPGSKVIKCSECGRRVVIRKQAEPTPCKGCGTTYPHPEPREDGE